MAPTRTYNPFKRSLLILLGLVVIATVCTPTAYNLVSGYRIARRHAHLVTLELALANYREKHGAFPPAVVPTNPVDAEHSWRVLLLPYLEHGEILKRYHLDEPWNGARNRLLLPEIPATYQFPGLEHSGSQVTNYVMLTGRARTSEGDDIAALVHSTDRLLPKILVVELPESDIQWTEPRDLTVLEAITKIRPGTMYLDWGCEAQMIPCDATPQAIKELVERSIVGRENLK